MVTRTCPICRVGKIARREVKTCGAPECVAVWRTLTTQQRARAVDEAEASAFPPIQPLENRGILRAPSSIPPPETSTERDNKFLTKIFGPDAPGKVEESEVSEVSDKENPPKK